MSGFWCERQQQMHFFTAGSVIMDYGLLCIWVKNILMLDVFQLLSSPDVNWWTGVLWITCGLLWCFYQLFGLSFWRHPFTAEDPLVIGMHRNENSWPKPKTEKEETKAENRKPKHRKKLCQLLVPLHLWLWLCTNFTKIKALQLHKLILKFQRINQLQIMQIFI